MKKYLVAALCIICVQKVHAIHVIKKEQYFIYKRIDSAIAYSDDSIRYILRDQNVSLKNCYYVNGEKTAAFVKIKSFDNMLLFDQKNFMYRIVNENSCGNPIEKLTAGDLNMYVTDTTKRLEDILATIVPLGEKSMNYNWPTAVIMWNLTIGVSNEKNPFEWERKLNEIFHYQINIIKINTDVHQDWPVDIKEFFFSSFNELNYKLNAGTILSDYKSK